MRELIILLVHAIATFMRVVRPGGVRAVVAESVLAKHQLLILSRSGRRAPEPPHHGSNYCWLLLPLDSAAKASTCGDRVQAVGVRGFSSRNGPAQIPALVFTEAKRETRPERSNRGV